VYLNGTFVLFYLFIHNIEGAFLYIVHADSIIVNIIWNEKGDD